MTMHFSHQDTDVVEHSLPLGIDAGALANHGGIYRRKVKPAFDIILTLLIAPIVVSVVFLLAALVALDGKSPFYSQMRLGRNGRVFRMWKLRTMVHNADKSLDSYLEENKEARLEWDKTQKLKDDPRITKVGRLMRKTSLDELPQMWNVLNGTMSLVGPRPMMPKQRLMYPGRGYFNLKPGITGLWQISDRNECEFSGRAYYDTCMTKLCL